MLVVKPTFEKELESLLNKHSQESASNTPDYVLAQYLHACLWSFNTAVQQRETWYGRDGRPSQLKPTEDKSCGLCGKPASAHTIENSTGGHACPLDGIEDCKDPQPMTVAEAQIKRCCRICGLPDKPRTLGNLVDPFVLDYGKEHAHRACLLPKGKLEADGVISVSW